MSTTYKIDPAHSAAHVVVRHMMITNVRGAFSNVQGMVNWDPANPGASTIEATID
ncbi:MAG: YceI family protein, partial [Acidobacteriota bacterium]|nr:YceI family protein [Acidobacteriota bacterium]